MGRKVATTSAGHKSLRCCGGVAVMIAVSKNDLLPQNASPSRHKLAGTHSARLLKHIAAEQIQEVCSVVALLLMPMRTRNSSSASSGLQARCRQDAPAIDGIDLSADSSSYSSSSLYMASSLGNELSILAMAGAFRSRQRCVTVWLCNRNDGERNAQFSFKFALAAR